MGGHLGADGDMLFFRRLFWGVRYDETLSRGLVFYAELAYYNERADSKIIPVSFIFKKRGLSYGVNNEEVILLRT